MVPSMSRRNYNGWPVMAPPCVKHESKINNETRSSLGTVCFQGMRMSGRICATLGVRETDFRKREARSLSHAFGHRLRRARSGETRLGARGQVWSGGQA